MIHPLSWSRLPLLHVKISMKFSPKTQRFKLPRKRQIRPLSWNAPVPAPTHVPAIAPVPAPAPHQTPLPYVRIAMKFSPRKLQIRPL